jgi:hypothetical protein
VSPAKPRKRMTETSEFEPVVVDKRLYAVLHHLNCRVTAIETALAKLTAAAAPPKRGRKPKSVAQQSN